MKFLSNNWRGLSILTLGVATVVAAVFFLDSCGDAGKMLTTTQGTQVPMRCHWTEQAVIGLGGLLGVIGFLMIWMKESARGLSLAAAAAGVLMVATPLWLLPTCGNAMMICNMSLKPGVLLLGGLIAIVGVVGAIRMARMGKALGNAA